MKFPRSVIRKVCLGAVLISLAVCVTLLIKESLDTKDPQSALPSIDVIYNGNSLPETSVFRAGYSWNFLTTIEDFPAMAPEDIPLYPVDVLPQIQMEIKFSKPPKELKISRADGRYSQDFIEIATDVTGEMLSPSVPGVYVYKVEASWGIRGSILYYFALQTKQV
ncbi:MAG: hypothetical protein RSD78_08495 [Oscillospiraceae bacterium]